MKNKISETVSDIKCYYCGTNPSEGMYKSYPGVDKLKGEIHACMTCFFDKKIRSGLEEVEIETPVLQKPEKLELV